ncbi:phage major capsid protein [Caminicella sporogenes]|uniref:phage major capsid protein n=1 Tax=Caminicella sporogenes TaxID=166485 RepID=UPI0025421650|nr:phage major capsid protein [Caminicella sporogenes]WIF95128.1 phage major capsid protein [Caminicella sporogenes]
MNKKLRELLTRANEIRTEIEQLLGEDRIDEAKAKRDDLKNIMEKIELLRDINSIEEPDKSSTKIDTRNEEKIEYRDIFFKAFKGKQLTSEESRILEEHRALSSTIGEDGGYIIPTDEMTAINELKRQLPSLENLVTVEPVNTLSGSRVLEKNADYTPFTAFTEGQDVPASDSPQFVQINYTITDRGGILPIPNNLLNDSDQNLRRYLRRWLAKKSTATRNKLIYDKLNTLPKIPISSFDDIKKILNVTLDPAIAAGASIIVNQDAYQWLDTQKDSDGNYILQPDPAQPGKKRLNGKPVIVISNKALPTRDDGSNYQAPILIGDLKEAVVLFDRQQMSILATQIGGTAFTKNRTEIRAIERADVQLFDSEAIVFGEINIGASV